MKNEDKVYLYSDGSMCRVINENDKAVKQVNPFIVKQKLKVLVHVMKITEHILY